MSIKDLFFEKEENTEEKKPSKSFGKTNVPEKSDVKFPTNSTNQTDNLTINSCKPFLDKIMSMYEKGFESLNKDGYDFFEFFKAIKESGAENSQMYNMAFTMAKTMDSSVTKETLINESNFYLSEINNVYSGYVKDGSVKKSTLESTKSNEQTRLSNEINDLKKQISTLSSLVSSKEIELSTIDNKYSSELHEIECKIMANDIAKDKIVSSIEKVVNGIKNNIK